MPETVKDPARWSMGTSLRLLGESIAGADRHVDAGRGDVARDGARDPEVGN